MSDETLSIGGGDTGGDSGGSAAPDVSSSSSAESPTIDSIFDEVAASLGEGQPTATVSAAPDPASTDAPTIAAQPEPVQPETPPPPSPGEPPKEKWDTILTNARTKERDAVLQQVVTQYGDALRVVESLRSDPVATVTQLISELQADPRFAQQMASHAARTLRAARQGAVSDEEPQADLDAGNGVFLYSAAQQAKREAWLERKWQQSLQQALAPVQQDLQARQQREQVEAAQHQAVTQTKTRLEKWTAQPHFAEHKDAIRTKQAEYFAAGHDTWDALALAYTDVLQRSVLPAQAKRERESTVAQAAQQLRAATPNPSTSAPAASRRPRNVDEAFEFALGELS